MAASTSRTLHSPLRPSRLRISSEPSIDVPFTSSPTIKKLHLRTEAALIPPPPQTPPAWSWTCHQCHNSFPLGVTRRCLHDGHRFCAGATLDRRGRVRRHRACGSTFDYVGWKAYKNWRNEADLLSRGLELPTPRSFRQRLLRSRNNSAPEATSLGYFEDDKENVSPTSPKNCERQCNFPSECRWSSQAKKEKTSTTKTNQTSGSPVSPASPSSSAPTATAIDPKALEKLESLKEPTPHSSQASADFRAPVLDFAAFKARLDKASARRRSRKESERPKLPELNLGMPMLMDVDAISPTSKLPTNKEIQVGITPDDQSQSMVEDIEMSDIWQSDSSSEESSGSERSETTEPQTEPFLGKPKESEEHRNLRRSKQRRAAGKTRKDLRDWLGISEEAWLSTIKQSEDLKSPV